MGFVEPAWQIGTTKDCHTKDDIVRHFNINVEMSPRCDLSEMKKGDGQYFENLEQFQWTLAVFYGIGSKRLDPSNFKSAADCVEKLSMISEVPVVLVLNYINMSTWTSGHQRHCIGVWRCNIFCIEEQYSMALSEDNINRVCGDNVHVTSAFEGLALTGGRSAWKKMIDKFNNGYLSRTMTSFESQFIPTDMCNIILRSLLIQSSSEATKRRNRRKEKNRKRKRTLKSDNDMGMNNNVTSDDEHRGKEIEVITIE
jgi:hypothetical protein